MQKSIEVWISQVVGKTTPVIKMWAECYPLPVGEAAARRLYAERGMRYPAALRGLLPFQGTEEAYWGLRVEEDRSVVDMFGLKGPKGLASVGRGLSVVRRFRLFVAWSRRHVSGATWWKPARHGGATSLWRSVLGRPGGSGAWVSADDFESDLRAAVGELHAQGQRVTQENVASLLHCDISTLKRWLKRVATSWQALRVS